MTINFEALQASLEKIGQLGQAERSFKAGDHAITIRVLQAREEIEVDKYAQIAWDEASGDEDRAALADYIDRVRVATLSHVIVQIGDQDLRREEFVETGEEDENGNKVKKPRYLVIREMIGKWSRPVLHMCYLNYGTLVQEVESASSKSIESSEANVGGEIDRLQTRLENLKRIQSEQKAMADRAAMTAQTREALGEYSQAHEDHIDRLATVTGEVVEESESEPEAAPKAEGATEPPKRPVRREPTIPRRAVPPVRAQKSEPVDADGIPLPHEGDSFYDPADGDAAVAAEHKRLEAFRQQKMRAQSRPTAEPEAPESPEPEPEPLEPLPGVTRGRKPPHRDALNTADAVLNLQGETVVDQPKAATEAVEGVRLPTETLSPRSKPTEKPTKAPVDPPPTGSRNPRFRGA